MSSPSKPEQGDPITAYPWNLSAQDQEGGPGLDADMKESAVWTKLEYWGEDGKPYLKEYEGQGLLKDKAVLITGGDSGIGRSVALLMAREGADISILYLPEEEKDAQWTLDQIAKSGRKGHGMQYNLREEANCKKAVEEHIKVFGKLNVLVNNSKCSPIVPFATLGSRAKTNASFLGSMQEACEDLKDIDMSVVEKTFKTNIIQMIAMAKYALPHMKRGDCIVNSASVASYMGNPQLVDYASTKGAIVTFTRALAQQQAPNGIRVNAVAPGIM